MNRPLARSYNWRDTDYPTPKGDWPWTALLES
jgi:hypothetical protein